MPNPRSSHQAIRLCFSAEFEIFPEGLLHAVCGSSTHTHPKNRFLSTYSSIYAHAALLTNGGHYSGTCQVILRTHISMRMYGVKSQLEPRRRKRHCGLKVSSKLIGCLAIEFDAIQCSRRVSPPWPEVHTVTGPT